MRRQLIGLVITRDCCAQNTAFEINGADAGRGHLFDHRLGVFAVAAAIFRYGFYCCGAADVGRRVKTDATSDPACALALLSAQ